MAAGARSRVVTKRIAPDAPRSIGRVLNVLEALVDFPDGASLSELANHMGMPKSSLLVLLKAMVASGHLTSLGQRYRLGSSSFSLAQRLISVQPGASILKDSLRELWLRTEETAVLARFDRDRRLVTYVDALESPLVIRYTVKLGLTRLLHCTAAGQAALAHQSEAYRESYLASTKLEQVTPDSITDPDLLREKLRQIRKDGYCVSVGEGVAGAVGIAAVVETGSPEIDHVLLVAGPTGRMEERVAEISAILLEVTRAASATLRHSA